MKRIWTRSRAAMLIAMCVPTSHLGGQSSDTLRMKLSWEVSEGTHPTADSLGRLSGIALGRDGTVYVSDAAASQIWVFDATGRSLRAIGRKGQGPGEFESPTGIAIGPDGILYVRDVIHVSRFAADSMGRLTQLVGSFRGPLHPDWVSTRAFRFATAGRIFYPAYSRLKSDTRPATYHVYTPVGVEVGTLEVPPFPGAPDKVAVVWLSKGDGRMLPGLSHVPLAPMPVWDVTSRGTVISGDGRTYVLRETDANGKVLRELRGRATPVRIPVREKRDSTAALKARLDSITVPLSQVQGIPDDVRALRLPDVYPAYMAVYATPEDQYWVMRWPVGGAQRSVFDVFASDGRLITTVVLPRAIATSPMPVLSLKGVAAVGVDAETGVHAVLRFVP